MISKLYLPRLAAALGSCALCLPSAVIAQTPPIPADASVDFDESSLPVVITPTRLRQSLADVPASITVITAETLRRYGITRIEEALRLVPGMHVEQASGSDYPINYHGTRNITPRRLNVMIDGVSAYLPAFSQIEWSLLPVSIEDIDRIEVIRGPDSSAYGPNSMMAVINILTKHPKDVEPVTMAVLHGSRHLNETTVRLATTLGGTSVSVTAHGHSDEGYDRKLVRNVALNEETGRQAHDGSEVHHLVVRAEHDMADGSKLNLQTAYLGGKGERDLITLIPTQTLPDVAVNTGLIAARWTKAISSNHEIQVNAFRSRTQAVQSWRSCLPPLAFWDEAAALYKANPAYAYQLAEALLRGTIVYPTPGSPEEAIMVGIAQQLMAPGGFAALTPFTCGTANQNGHEARTHVEVQDTYVFSDRLRAVGGVGWRTQSATSQTYFNGSVQNNVSWVFGHVEFRPLDWLTFNAGGYSEHNTLSGHSFSPRLAVNARLSSSQTVRAVVSKGTRTPDLFEEKADWRYTLTDLSIPVRGSTTGVLFAHAKAPGNLHSEQIVSAELGYLLQLKQVGLTMDVRLFDERLSHLISDVLAIQEFTPENNGSVRLTGAEMQSQWDITSRWSAFLNYSYLLSRDAQPFTERAQYSKHSGAFGFSVALTDRWRASLAHYASTGDAVHQLRYARSDLTLLRDFSWGQLNGTATLGVSHLDTPQARSARNLQQYYQASFDDRLSFTARMRVAF